METINSFQTRLDDMYNGSTPRPLKRKLLSSYSTPSPGYSHETKLLGSFDKRMKSAQWQLHTRTRTDLFPSSVRSLSDLDKRYRYDPLGYHSQIKIPQHSPRPLPSAGRSVRKAVITTAPESPYVPGKPGRVYNESLLVPRESDKLVSAFSRHDRHSDSLVRDKDREIQLLRIQLKKEREVLERAKAEILKKDWDLKEFKEMVALRQRKNEKLEQGLHNVSGPTEGISILPREDLRVIAINFPSTYLGASAGGMSRRGSHSDDEKIQSGSNRESEHEPVWKELLNKVNEPSKIDKEFSLLKEIEYTQSKLLALQLERPAGFKARKKDEDKTLADAFTPLSSEAEDAVDEALQGGDRDEILVTHEKSNIDVTRAVLHCLSPGVWLNDEVINVYMELLKEREMREPDRFLKCHFFNTFFYNKLYKDKRSYDYKAIRRWTTQKKLGYSLSDCDKILVPIHQDIHWCLAVINVRDKRLEYLDSLKGGDRSVLDVLAKYIADEVKDKDGKDLDASTWDQDFPNDIPEQMNGCDCGMFMVKYADFHSRGGSLQFTQDHMEYFRRKMVWEILDLKAT